MNSQKLRLAHLPWRVCLSQKRSSRGKNSLPSLLTVTNHFVHLSTSWGEIWLPSHLTFLTLLLYTSVPHLSFSPQQKIKLNMSTFAALSASTPDRIIEQKWRQHGSKDTSNSCVPSPKMYTWVTGTARNRVVNFSLIFNNLCTPPDRPASDSFPHRFRSTMILHPYLYQLQ